MVDPAALFNIGFYDPVAKSADVQRWLRDEAFAAQHGARSRRARTSRRQPARRPHPRLLHHPRPADLVGGAVGLARRLAAMRGDDLLRLKAIVALSDRPDQPVVLHGVQHLFHPPVLLPNGRARTGARGSCSSPATCRKRRSRRPSTRSRRPWRTTANSSPAAHATPAAGLGGFTRLDNTVRRSAILNGLETRGRSAYSSGNTPLA